MHVFMKHRACILISGKLYPFIGFVNGVYHPPSVAACDVYSPLHPFCAERIVGGAFLSEEHEQAAHAELCRHGYPHAHEAEGLDKQ